MLPAAVEAANARAFVRCARFSWRTGDRFASVSRTRAFAIDVWAQTTAAGLLDAMVGAGVPAELRPARISTAELMSGSNRVNGMR